MTARSDAFKRDLTVRWVANPVKGSAATFLWGPRQTGKTALLREQSADALFYDLLDTDLSADLAVRPGRLREEVLAQSPRTVVVDEVQGVPALIDEVLWLLEDALLGFTLEPWRRTKRRRLADTAKFYLFDIGIAKALNPETTQIAEGSDVYGRAFEHFLLNEVRACISYPDLGIPLSFWRTHSGFEVDLIVGDLQLALEFKSSRRLRQSDLKGLRALADEHVLGRAVVVCREDRPRRTEDGIDILPWRAFCEQLWAGDIIGLG